MVDLRRINHIFHYPVYLMVFLYLLSSCSSTKYLKPNQYLLKENKVSLDGKSIDRSEVKNYAEQKPNRKILGWPFYVALYNMVDPVKELDRDLKRDEKLLVKNQKRMAKGKKIKTNPFYFSRWWRNSVGEAPIIYNARSIPESKISMNGYLRNLGYYYSHILDSTQLDKERKRATVFYAVHEGWPYKYAGFKIKVKDVRVSGLIHNNQELIFPDTQSLFNAYELDDLRYKISEHLQNNGYYGFGPEQIVYYADTLVNAKKVHVYMNIYSSAPTADSTVDSDHIRAYKYRNISVLNYPYDLEDIKTLSVQTDYYGKDSIPFHYYKKLTFKPYLLQRRLDIKKDSLYRSEDISRSMRAINGLGIFRAVNFKIKPSPGQDINDSIQQLDCEIQLSPSTKQSYTIDLEGYTSSGTIGTGLKFIYSHKNLFKRAIYFNLSLNGKLERFTSASSLTKGTYAYEYGFNSTLRFPKFFAPFRLYKFNNKYFPNTIFNVNYTFKDRADYIRQTSSAGYGYAWSTPKGIKHNLNPVDFYLTEFKDIDYDYLKYLIDKNLYDQYFDHVIPAGNYSFFYTTQKFNVPKNFFFVNLRVELAGNIFTLANNLLNSSKTGSGDLYFQVIEAIGKANLPDSLQQDFIENYRDSLNTFGPSYYTFAGILYNQYFKTDIDLRYNWFWGKHLSLVTRFFGGIIIPYGNTDFSPIEKQYFVGGSNDLRAWYARSIGPGSYVLDEQTLQLKNYYQHGDIKLLANVELRHDILWRIRGALFADVGNVWNLRYNSGFPNGQFKFNQFYQQLAFGVGYGLRLDFNFFILRFDLAFKIHDPSLNGPSKWVYSQGNKYYKRPILNFGIGLPF